MRNINKIKYSLALVLFSVTLQAQATFPDDVNDVPIDSWGVPMFVVGLFFFYYFYKKEIFTKIK